MDTPLFIMHIVDKTSITQKINNYFVLLKVPPMFFLVPAKWPPYNPQNQFVCFARPVITYHHRAAPFHFTSWVSVVTARCKQSKNSYAQMYHSRFLSPDDPRKYRHKEVCIDIVYTP